MSSETTEPNMNPELFREMLIFVNMCDGQSAKADQPMPDDMVLTWLKGLPMDTKAAFFNLLIVLEKHDLYTSKDANQD